MRQAFVYGTLLFPEVLEAVTGRVADPRPASVAGFSRWRLIGEVFPAIVAAAPDQRVTGAVYDGLDDADWRKLDAFEGEIYERRLVTVRVAAAPAARSPAESAAPVETSHAHAYVLRDRFRHRLAAEPWDLEQFVRHHLAAYVARLSRARPAPSSRLREEGG